jgi:hypothetical protein
VGIHYDIVEGAAFRGTLEFDAVDDSSREAARFGADEYGE